MNVKRCAGFIIISVTMVGIIIDFVGFYELNELPEGIYLIVDQSYCSISFSEFVFFCS